MNQSVPFPPKLATVARWLSRLAVVLLFLHLALPARATEERYLLIFNTSSAMKKRLPAVSTLITNFYTTGFAGAIHGGDTVGVWTLNDKLHVGEFPLSQWLEDEREQTAVSLVEFLHKQKYSGETSLAALQPALDRVITNSDRLTIFIVCDGTSEITWTPYNDSINQTLRQTQAERKSARQPVVIALRTENGKYIGNSISFPPNGLTVPIFPPRPPKPEPVKIVTAPSPAPAPAPVITGPPLVIVGTHVGTNLDQLNKTLEQIRSTNPVTAPAPTASAPPTPPLGATVPPPATVPAPAPIPAPVPTPAAPPANVPVATAAPSYISTTTSATPATITTTVRIPDEKGYQLLLPIAIGVLSLAIILSAVAIIRSRRPRGSLITDSMNAPKHPLDRK